jgi:hypothetical protein
VVVLSGIVLWWWSHCGVRCCAGRIVVVVVVLSLSWLGCLGGGYVVVRAVAAASSSVLLLLASPLVLLLLRRCCCFRLRYCCCFCRLRCCRYHCCCPCPRRRHPVGWLTPSHGSQPLGWVRIVVVGVVASHVVVRYAGVGHKGSQWGGMGWNEGLAKTNHDESRGSFSRRTAWASHFLGPPGVSPSSNPPSNLRRTTINRPHPFGKGMGRLWCDLASEVS